MAARDDLSLALAAAAQALATINTALTATAPLLAAAKTALEALMHPIIVVTPSLESAQGATINSTTGHLTDRNGDTWTLVPSANGFQIAKDNVADPVTGNVILLLYWNHQIYQENSALNWWVWNGTTWVQQAGDPRSAGSGTPTPPPGAVAAGLTALVFNDDFTYPNTAAMLKPNGPWYNGLAWQGAGPVGDIQLDGVSTVTINNDDGSNINIASMTNDGVGLGWTPPYYAESMIFATNWTAFVLYDAGWTFRNNLCPSVPNGPVELDVIETDESQPNRVVQTLHVGSLDNGTCGTGPSSNANNNHDTTTTIINNWNVFAALVTGSVVRWFLNGVQVGPDVTPFTSTAHKVFAAFGPGPGGVNGGAVVHPVIQKMDWFRVWQAPPAGPTPPLQAVSAGFITNDFNENFTNIAQSIDLGNTQVPGFRWYIRDPFSGTPHSASNFAQITGGGVRVTGDGFPNQVAFTQNPTGTTFTRLFGYTEWLISIENPGSGMSPGWAAVWSLSLQHLTVNDNVDYIEDDDMEWFGYPAWTLHEWGNQNPTGAHIQSDNNIPTLDPTQKFLVGHMHQDLGGGNGWFKVYINNVFRKGIKYGPSIVPFYTDESGNNSGGSVSGAATRTFQKAYTDPVSLIFGTGSNMPLSIFHVYHWTK